MISFPFPEASVSAIGKLEFVHNGVISDSGAFELKTNAKIRILLPRGLGAVSVRALIYNESLNKLVLAPEFVWCDIIDGFDLYESDPAFVELGVGLYYFRIKIQTGREELFGHNGGSGNVVIERKNTGRHFQISISDFKYSNPKNIRGGVIYHIFVDRFRRGGNVKKKDNAIYADDWSTKIPEYPDYPGAPLKNNTFYGGTLYGIIEKLDYIASLGVNLIYLSPVFDSPSNHKYDTSDYMTVDSMFGGDPALQELILKAKERGIGIILDGVFNHTGSDSIYFNKYGNFPTVGAYQSEKSEYYSWYEFQSHPDKYTCWWGIDILPRINPSKAECGNYFVGNGGVVEKYAKMGIAGLRLDVADELSDSFIADIKNRLNAFNNDSVLYGEVWEDASSKIAYDVRKKYYLGTELDGVMNYPVRTGIIKYLCNHSTEELRYALSDIINNAPQRIRDMQMNLLGTHDTERILTVLGGESSSGKSNAYLATKRMNSNEKSTAKRRLLMAYTILGTLPGIPTIFYGDEAGLEGYHDPFNRMPYPWGQEDMEILEHYRSIGMLRRKNAVYKSGGFKLLHLDKDLLVFLRYGRGENQYITVINNSDNTVTLNFENKASILLPKLRGGFYKHEIPPFTSCVIKSQSNTIKL